MKETKNYRSIRGRLAFSASLLTFALACNTSPGYETYSGSTDSCATCHGDFRGPTSTKGTVFPSNNNHEMHRASTSMGTACNLCHTGTTRVPVFIATSNGTANNTGVGCSGCHMGEGLRKHHLVNGVTVCLDCHTDGPPPPETTKPPYYGTADTKVKNPANDVLASNTNENWSVGDFLGLDNDGNNLYDLADYAVGPFRLLSAQAEGNNMRVTWLTAGGRTDTVQASGVVNGTYTNASLPLSIPGVGLVTNSYVDVGGATNATRYYRLNAQVP